MGKYRPVSTAEKKLLLAYPDEWNESVVPPAGWYPKAWPIGADGLPKGWVRDSSRPNGGSWCLCSGRRKRDAALREKRMSLGLCSSCGKTPPARTDGWHCNECLDKKLSPEKLMQSRRRMALRYRNQRRERGTLQAQE